MEVLTPYPSPPLSPSKSHSSLRRLQSPYSSSRPSKSSSLLVRRSSRQALLPHSAELALSVDRALLLKFHGDSSSHSMTALNVPRRPSGAVPRSFAPLTPIVASPMTTPTPSMSSNIYVTIDKGRDKLHAVHGSSERDYLTKGAPAASVPQTKAIVAMETPTWTSTPPTPPPKSLHHRSASSGATRAADTGGGSATSASSTSSSSSIWVYPSASLPASLSPHALPSPPSSHVPFTRKRRASLPASLSKSLPHRPILPKPLPPTPPHPPSPSLKTQQQRFKSSRLFESSIQDAMTGEAARPAPKRLLFHVPDGSSDREDEGERFTESPKEMYLDAAMAAGSGDSSGDSPRLTEKRKDDVRRYHALMELLMTEVGYLMYLREMVNAYIRQIPTLSCRPATHGSSSTSLSPFSRTPTSSTFMISPLSSSSRTNSHTHMMMMGALSSPNSSATICDTSLNASFNSTHNNVNNVNNNTNTNTNTTPGKNTMATTRYMFSDQEVELVTRNIEDILLFHEAFVDELRAALTPLGFCMDPEDGDYNNSALQHVRQQKKEISQPEQNLEAAIAIVSEKFTTQASCFTIYELFCSGQSEALDLVHKIQEEHTVEWDAFEQRCSQLVANMRNPITSAQTVEGHQQQQPPTPVMNDTEMSDHRRKRGYSLSSLDAVNTLHVPNKRSNVNLKHSSSVSTDAHGHGHGHAGRDKSGGGSRLVFIDYLIKPVQRICRYPLLLDQLKIGKSIRNGGGYRVDGGGGGSSSGESTSSSCDPDAAVGSALQAMKDVASSVDEARRRQDIITKSSLIATRISSAFSTQSSSSSSSRSVLGHNNLTLSFLSSLGACLLAGSMDVIHHYADKIPGSSGTVKAKYLGAFLYMGGYLILVKVGKGKVYEPKHWFSLVGFEIVDVPEEEALLPCSFRVSCMGQHFDMAAACQREKDVWLSAFQESITFRPHWTNEPASSLHADTRNEFFFSMMEDGPSDGIPPVPPLPPFQQLIPPLERGSSTPMFSRPDTSSPSSKALLRPDIPSRQDLVSLPASRRSSTASVKAIFSPMSESTILIRRASPPARLQVERRLQDVFSDICLTARFHANTHEEELFQAPKFGLSGFSRSNSGLGMAGMGVAAKNRLTKRESVLVHRRKSSIDSHNAPSEADFQLGVSKRLSTAKSLANRRHMKKLKIMSLPTTLSSECEDGPGDIFPDSPLAMSQCSSVTASNPGSAAGSPVKDSILTSRIVPVRSNTNIPRPDLLLVREADYRPKRSRSMVDNVKGIFQSRSSSPASSLSGDQSLPITPEGPHPQLNPGINSGLFKWWSGSLRRRVRSAPDSPEDGPSFTRRMFSASNLTLSKPILTRRDEERSDFLSTSESGQLHAFIPPVDTNASSLPFQQQHNSSPPMRRRSLFSTSSYRRQSIASTASETVPPKLQRSFTLLQRLSPLNSTTISADIVPM